MPSFTTLLQKNSVRKHAWKRLLNYALSLNLVPLDGTACSGRTPLPLLPLASQDTDSITPGTAVGSPQSGQGGCKEKDYVFPHSVNLFCIFLPFKDERRKTLEKRTGISKVIPKEALTLTVPTKCERLARGKLPRSLEQHIKSAFVTAAPVFLLPTWSASCCYRPNIEITIQILLSNLEGVWEFKQSSQPELWLCAFLL